jgi:predicted amidophosphoribosyltransferase
LGLAAWGKAAANVLLSQLFEPPCAACRTTLAHPLDGAVCDLCWSSLGAAPPLELRFDARHAISWAIAVDAYDGRMKDVIHALKYDRRRTISPRLGALMRDRGAALLRDADCVVPVPLHPRREFARGFNQARDLAIHLGPPVLPLLKRVVFTQSQIELPREQRLANVRNAFVLDPGSRLSAFAAEWPLRRDHAVARFASGGGPVPETVVLIDDVATTGATLEQCAMVLKRSGVREVRALTAARVVNARR